MAQPSSSPAAGGAFIALGALAGAAIGFLFGQATPGMLVGLVFGIAAAVAVWLKGRR